MCKVTVTATLEHESIYIEESGNSHSLLYAVEGEDPAPVARRAWRDYIRDHLPQSLHLQLQAALPPRRLKQVQKAFRWLLHKIVRRRRNGE